jgi:hypothetical protein
MVPLSCSSPQLRGDLPPSINHFSPSTSDDSKQAFNLIKSTALLRGLVAGGFNPYLKVARCGFDKNVTIPEFYDLAVAKMTGAALICADHDPPDS